MSTQRAIQGYVSGAALTAIALLAYLNTVPRPAQIDGWALGSFAFVGLMLELSRTANKSSSMTGSLVFIMHLAMGVALGGFWGALTAAATIAVTQVHAGVASLKVLFNVSERILSVGIAFTVYVWLGGQHPPALLLDGAATLPFPSALGQVAIFLCAALIYFVTNSIAVNAAVAISTGKSIFSTWRANTLWVLGYDIAASLLALGVAFMFVKFQAAPGVGKLGFIAVFLPFVAVRHFYAKVNELQETLRELDNTYEQLELNVREQLVMMVKAIEARDPYTSGHSRRVCGLSRAIAIDLGLDSQHIGDIENAALMHDVGKIHAEFAPLLQKESKLTDEEWEIMKTHSIRSSELVSLFSRFQGYVVECVRHHHERWDGMGYPDRLAGEEIPLGARIIAIADTIDAMTTNRPYRDALPLDVVLAELNKGRSTQFDAELVELTINSVTVRRLIADPSSIPEYIPEPRIRSRADSRARERLPLQRVSERNAV